MTSSPASCFTMPIPPHRRLPHGRYGGDEQEAESDTRAPGGEDATVAQTMVRVSTPIASLSNELTGFTDPPAYRTARTIFSPPRSPAKRPTSPVKFSVGSPGGISPPGSHRSVRDNLSSYG